MLDDPDRPEKRTHEKAQAEAHDAALVLEPARWIAATRPETVVLEQVPAALPIWQHTARELRLQGYSAWSGTLCAADYGVPQTRVRAILIASRAEQVSAPAPTHAEHPAEDLFGDLRLPWVFMATALGWHGEDRPARTLAGNRAPRWLYDDPDGTHGRIVKRSNYGEDGDTGRRTTHDAVRITTEEAATLQSFPDGYPWQGNKTRVFEQIGNAVPPLLAAHCVAAARGLDPALITAATPAA